MTKLTVRKTSCSIIILFCSIYFPLKKLLVKTVFVTFCNCAGQPKVATSNRVSSETRGPLR